MYWTNHHTCYLADKLDLPKPRCQQFHDFLTSRAWLDHERVNQKLRKNEPRNHDLNQERSDEDLSVDLGDPDPRCPRERPPSVSP